MLRRSKLFLLLDVPRFRPGPILTMADELLLADWEQKEFDAYAGCREWDKPDKPFDIWTVDQGYLRNFTASKGSNSRIYGQFAMRQNKKHSPYFWQPAIFDTGSCNTYFCRNTLQCLGLNPYADAPNGFSAFIGANVFEGITVSEHQEATPIAGGNVNLLGMDFIKKHNSQVEKIFHEMILNCIGHPTRYPLWVQQRDADGKPVGVAFPVTPEVNDVARLKEAIKTKLGTDYTRNPALISIFNSKQEELQKMSASLEENTEEAPYFFALPP